MVLGLLATALAGCGSRSGPASQPLDLGKQPQQQGGDQHLAENGNHERQMPSGGLAAQPGGSMMTNGARPAPGGATVAAPQQIAQQGSAGDDPTQPTAAEPLLDANGFDPTPQGGGEIDHSSGGDIAPAPSGNQ